VKTVLHQLCAVVADYINAIVTLVMTAKTVFSLWLGVAFAARRADVCQTEVVKWHDAGVCRKA